MYTDRYDICMIYSVHIYVLIFMYICTYEHDDMHHVAASNACRLHNNNN